MNFFFFVGIDGLLFIRNNLLIFLFVLKLVNVFFRMISIIELVFCVVMYVMFLLMVIIREVKRIILI